MIQKCIYGAKGLDFKYKLVKVIDHLSKGYKTSIGVRPLNAFKMFVAFVTGQTVIGVLRKIQ